MIWHSVTKKNAPGTQKLGLREWTGKAKLKKSKIRG